MLLRGWVQIGESLAGTGHRWCQDFSSTPTLHQPLPLYALPSAYIDDKTHPDSARSVVADVDEKPDLHYHSAL